MRLIGMMDSPYVRRVAVSMKLMGVSFEHQPLSVFRHFDDFAAINPVVKAPTLVTDDGIVLLDSTLILEHVERLAPRERRLTPDDIAHHARAQHVLGLALAACEKTVQIVYETNLRPTEARHQPWLDRVWKQLLAAFRLLEEEIGEGKNWLFDSRPLQADVTAAVTWRFAQHMLATDLPAGDYPGLSRFSERAEALPEFRSSPLD